MKEVFLNTLDPHFKKSFQESLEDNQVRYHNQIYQALGYSFEPIKNESGTKKE
ncbi:hypothetical protein ACQJ6L_05225 [Helicobacter pylori]